MTVREEILREECAAAGRLEAFERLRAEGNGVEFAAVLALQRPPGTKGTDRALLEGTHNQFANCQPIVRDHILNKARKAGIDVTGKVYKGGLGGYDDPLAWISSVGDIKRAAEIKNLNVTGIVEHKAVEKPPVEQPALAPDIVARLMKKACNADPALASKVSRSKKAARELRSKVINEHTPHFRRHLIKD